MTPDVPPVRRSRLRRIALDVTPLRVSRDFRLLWGGGFLSELGSQFARIAIYVQVTELTGSAAAVGMVGLTGLAGIIFGTLVGGSFIDAHDRRRTLMWAQVAHTVSSAILLGGAISRHPPVWLIYLASALHASVSAVDAPTRSAMTPRLVGKALMPSAVALNQVLWQTVAIVGSAVGGLLIAKVGFGAAYAIDLATYGALFLAAFLMRPMPPDREPGKRHGVGGGEGGVRVRATEPPDPVDVRDRPDRDDLRDAAGAVHVPRHLPVPSRTRGGGTPVRRAGRGRARPPLTAGWAKSVRRQGRP